jgi:uncharacterized protein YhbP (UPF0306 family)
MSEDEFAPMVRRVIDANLYLVLGTADASGQPWVSPVYFTPDRYTNFYWASSPQTRHSQNLADRPEVSLCVFDSQVPIGGAEAVYMSGVAGLVAESELAASAELYGARLPEGRRFRVDELRAPGLFRLYRARISEHSVLIRGGDPTYGTGADGRRVVRL